MALQAQVSIDKSAMERLIHREAKRMRRSVRIEWVTGIVAAFVAGVCLSGIVVAIFAYASSAR